MFEKQVVVDQENNKLQAGNMVGGMDMYLYTLLYKDMYMNKAE